MRRRDFWSAVITRAHVGSAMPAAGEERVVKWSYRDLQSVNIALSNISLLFVSVALHQVIRSLTPVFTVLIGLPFGYGTPSRAKLLTLVPVIVGVSVACATADMTQSSSAGIGLTLLSAAVSALKGVLTNRFLVGAYRMHPLELVRRMAPVAGVLLLPWFRAYELEGVRAYFAAPGGRMVDGRWMHVYGSNKGEVNRRA